MSSPYGPSGSGNDPQQPWGQQPSYGQQPGPSSDSFPGQQQQQYPPQQPQYPQQPGKQQYAAPGPQQTQTGQQPYTGGFPQQDQPMPGYPGATPPDQLGYLGEPQPRKRSGLIWTLAVVIVIIVAVVAILGFVWPGWFTQKVFDDSLMQTGIQQILHDDYKLNVSGVSCNGVHDVKVGSQFSCTATIDGQPKQVQVTVKTADGLYEVAQPQ
jgi:hypothetical protein